MTQNNQIISQCFNPMVIDYITKFVKYNFEVTDNNMRADLILNYLKDFGFEEVGCGTNRIVVKHEMAPGIVFKIALDTRGIQDNDLEEILSSRLQPYVTVTYDNTGTISASEYVQTMTKDDMEENYDIVSDILHHIGSAYILNDVGPKAFMNWGYRVDSGEIVILDYAYLTPITQYMDFSCKAKAPGKKHKKCGGPLGYSKDFSEFVCTCCGARFAIGDIASTPEKDDSTDFNTSGLDLDQYPELQRLEEGSLIAPIEEDDRDEFGFNTNF